MAESANPESPERPAAGPKTAVPAEAETRFKPEVPASMLDVHALHQPVRSWKDFFIHIATIVIGLLIAIGLEQTVELFHHRHQVADARRQLDTELKINLATFHAQMLEGHRYVPVLQHNLEILQYLRGHAGAPSSTWPGELSWWFDDFYYVLSAWTSAQESGVLALMPRREVQERAALYGMLAELNDRSKLLDHSIWVCLSYGIRNQDPASMKPAELDASIQAVTDALFQYARLIGMQWNLHRVFPQFSPAPDPADWRRITHVVSPARDQAEAAGLDKQLEDEIERIQAQDRHR
jgi:hypothetical protein